jgi:hypothetical protein
MAVDIACRAALAQRGPVKLNQNQIGIAQQQRLYGFHKKETTIGCLDQQYDQEPSYHHPVSYQCS